MSEAAALPIRSNSFFSAGLAAADPEIARAIELELGRLRDDIELIASENIVSKAVLEAQGSVMTNKYAEGYPGRRYYGGCQFVDMAENLAIERACQLFGCKLRQRPAEFRQPGQSGRVHGADAAGRHVHGARPRRRRPSDPRFAGQHVGALVQAGGLRRRPRDASRRHGGRGQAGARAQAEDDHRRRLGLCAPLGFRRLPRHLRRGRGLFRRRHRPFRRAGGGRRASLAVPPRPRRHHDDPQDAARARAAG